MTLDLTYRGTKPPTTEVRLTSSECLGRHLIPAGTILPARLDGNAHALVYMNGVPFMLDLYDNSTLWVLKEVYRGYRIERGWYAGEPRYCIHQPRSPIHIEQDDLESLYAQVDHWYAQEDAAAAAPDAWWYARLP